MLFLVIFKCLSIWFVSVDAFEYVSLHSLTCLYLSRLVYRVTVSKLFFVGFSLSNF